MKRPPTVSRGLILRLPYADIHDEILDCKGDPIAERGRTFMHRLSALFEVGEGCTYQPQMNTRVLPATVLGVDYIFDPVKSCQVLMVTIRLQLRVDA